MSGPGTKKDLGPPYSDTFLSKCYRLVSIKITQAKLLINQLATLGWNVTKPNATMYLWVRCPVGMDSTSFALSVLQQTGVVVTPGNAFGKGGEGYVRISLIAEPERLQEAVTRLRDAGIRYQTETAEV